MELGERAERLAKALTTEQLAGLVVQLLEGMPEADHPAFLAALSPDVVAVLESNAQPADSPGKHSPPLTSDEKFSQHFRSVLRDWSSVVFELGDEEGDYVCQEHDWEPPEFDAYRLARDIERCAGTLLPLLDRAAQLGLEDENLFLELAEEITEAIAEYPDHIYTGDGVWLEAKGTECILRWIDLHARSEAVFLAKVLEFADKVCGVALDQTTVSTHVLEAWQEKRRRALFGAIEKRLAHDSGFRDKASTPGRLWYRIRYALASELDPARRIEIAAGSVDRDWTKGADLVALAMAAGDSASALSFCRRTVSAYCDQQMSRGQGTTETFDPETTPLLPGWCPEKNTQLLGRVLGIWEDLSAGANDPELAALLRVQRALLTQPEDWTNVRDAFAQTGASGAPTLFEAWKKRAIGQLRPGLYSLHRADAGPWLDWLIEAGFNRQFEIFTEKAIPWLGKQLQSGGHAPRPPQLSLAADLFALASGPTEYPVLEAMLRQGCRLADCPSRLEWLAQTDVPELTGHAVQFLRRNLPLLVPSPGGMAGDYTLAAGWLAATREMVPEAAREILQHWRTEYKRRRNLWRDLRAYGLGV